MHAKSLANVDSPLNFRNQLNEIPSMTSRSYVGGGQWFCDDVIWSLILKSVAKGERVKDNSKIRYVIYGRPSIRCWYSFKFKRVSEIKLGFRMIRVTWHKQIHNCLVCKWTSELNKTWSLIFNFRCSATWHNGCVQKELTKLGTRYP